MVLSESADLVCPGGLVLHDGPGPSIVAVSHFERGDKLDGAEVFGALRDDPRDLLGRLQVHLQNQNQNQASGLEPQAGRRRPRGQHLEPLGAVVGGGGPGVGLALLVQTGVVGVPGEGLQTPGPERTGPGDLTVRHQARLHSHRLRTTWEWDGKTMVSRSKTRRVASDAALTVELAAHQLHAERARPPTHQRNHTHELGDDRRVEQVGLGPVVVHVPNEHLQRRGRSQRPRRWQRLWRRVSSRGRGFRPPSGTR